MPALVRPRSQHYVCDSCTTPHPKWVGRCSSCSAWNSLVEVGESAGGRIPPADARPLSGLAPTGAKAVPTGLAEADRALGGGLVPGSVTLLGGEPGVGKSTLILQLAAARAQASSRVLLVSAEESASQVRLRAGRLGAVHDDLWLGDDQAVEGIVSQLDRLQPALLIVDSIQTVHLAADEGAPGSLSQVRACAHRLVVEAKTRGLAIVLVGHLTDRKSVV